MFLFGALSSRASSLLTLRSRSLCREGHVEEWIEACFACSGAAAKDNSALLEAHQRATREELSDRAQVPQRRAPLDISQLCDSIGWIAPGEETLELDYPADILGLELLQCAALRPLTQS